MKIKNHNILSNQMIKFKYYKTKITKIKIKTSSILIKIQMKIRINLQKIIKITKF